MIELVRYLIFAGALAHGQSPERMDRMAFCESRYNPFAINRAGPYVGLYQLGSSMQRTFYVRGYDNLYDPSQQVNFTAEMLSEGRSYEWSCR